MSRPSSDFQVPPLGLIDTIRRSVGGAQSAARSHYFHIPNWNKKGYSDIRKKCHSRSFWVTFLPRKSANSDRVGRGLRRGRVCLFWKTGEPEAFSKISGYSAGSDLEPFRHSEAWVGFK